MAQPPVFSRPSPALSTAQRDLRIKSELQAFSGKPIAGPFKVGPGLPVPTQVISFGMDMVRSTLFDASGGLALFLPSAIKTPVDVLRPLVTIRLKPHTKPYLADCTVSALANGQLAYLDTADSTYPSQVIEKKSVVTVQDGHALFAIAAASANRYLFLGPIVLDPAKAYSMSFERCEFSQVG